MAQIESVNIEQDGDGYFVYVPGSSRFLAFNMPEGEVLVERPDNDDEEVRIPLYILSDGSEVPEGAEYLSWGYSAGHGLTALYGVLPINSSVESDVVLAQPQATAGFVDAGVQAVG